MGDECHDDIFSSSSFWVLNKKLVRSLGCEIALYLTYLVDRQKYLKTERLAKDEWFFCTYEEVEEFTGIPTYRQRLGIKILKELDVLETVLKGIPAKQWFKLKMTAKTFKRICIEGTDVKDKVCDIEKVKRFNEIKKRNSAKLESEYHPDINKNSREEEQKQSKTSLPLVSLATYVDEGDSSNVKELNKRYITFAEKLNDICYNFGKKKQNNTTLQSWSNHFRLLNKTDDINITTINTVLEWYSANIGKEFVAECFCAKSFRTKFPKLQSAIQRDKRQSSQQRKGSIRPGDTVKDYGYNRVDIHMDNRDL